MYSFVPLHYLNPGCISLSLLQDRYRTSSGWMALWKLPKTDLWTNMEYMDLLLFHFKPSEYNMYLDMKKGIFIAISKELVRNKKLSTTPTPKTYWFRTLTISLHCIYAHTFECTDLTHNSTTKGPHDGFSLLPSEKSGFSLFLDLNLSTEHSSDYHHGLFSLYDITLAKFCYSC